MSKPMLDDFKLHVKAKLSVLWASATLCYLYGDVISFYQPGMLQSMLDGKMGYWPVTPELLLGISAFMATPGVMVFLTFALSPTWSRWLNVAMGALYTATMLFTMVGAWSLGNYFYILLGVVEVVLTGLVVWYALTWPRRQVPAGSGEN